MCPRPDAMALKAETTPPCATSIRRAGNRLRITAQLVRVDHFEGFVKNSKSVVPFSEQFSESSGKSPASGKK